MRKQTLIEYGALLTEETQGYHFLLSAGGHSNQYVQCEALMQNRPGRTIVREWLVSTNWYDKLYVPPAYKKNWEEFMPDVVIGGALGGIRFATLVENLLSELICSKDSTEPSTRIRSVFCERKPTWYVEEKGDFSPDSIDPEYVRIKSGPFQLKRGFEIKEGEKVLIAEDVTTTAKSIGEVAELVRSYKGIIVGAISIIDRRPVDDQQCDSDHLHIPQRELDFIRPYVPLVRLDIPTWTPEECPLCKKGSEARKQGSRK